ncbi:uncharacterized protein LOC126741110 isoform X2 [Anthonomus grandis grandis]|uniref:uncharacterized protein LOC126741110 isoform X2 n=1 Tax=Anthonomus grandis grandis TaxID=2921223 RepID=UPI002166348F|nr:uncharacterized protein LOC126741110 isoform X2 [Anthonomus grandis grandis]
MSPKKQPQSLNSLTIDVLSNRLIEVLSDDEGIYSSDIQKFMASSTSDGLQSLLDKILDVIAQRGTGLQHLNLKGVWARDYPHLLTHLLLSLKFLKTLMIPHMADDRVIQAIASLQHLVKLDISGEACYSCTGIRLLKSASIRILDIGSFGKLNLCQDACSGYELVAEILENLPNLNVLKTYSFTGHSLLLLYEKNSNFKTKLTYIHATDCDLNVFTAMTATCPYLENVHVNCPREGVVARLGDVGRLLAVKITKGEEVELKTFLRDSRSHLDTLKLNHSGGSLDLSELCESAPYLSTLECYQMHLKFINPLTFFMCLKKVHILYCDISDNVVKTLLSNAPFLRSITVGCPLEMTDGDMFRILAECTLENLEELLLNDARFLTVFSVELLADNCPNLRLLGSLTGWEVTQEQIDSLRVLLALSNVDLTLWPQT